MFKTNGLEINVSGIQLITDLKESLNQNGIELLGSIKTTPTNVMFSCPSHKDGQEKKPSCGMSLYDKWNGDKFYPAGTIHCFTCGYTATLEEFISFCFGYQDMGRFGNRWLKSNYHVSLLRKQRRVDLNISRTHEHKEYDIIPEDILDEFRYTHPYMYQRGLTERIIALFDVGYSHEDNCITIPVRNLIGAVNWVQTRDILQKRYFIPNGITKTDFLLGAYECLKYNINKEPVYIVESPFNMFTLWKLGFFAICLFGTGGGRQYELLKQLPFRHYILALDNDEAGERGTIKLIRELQTTKLLSRIMYKEKGKDINDLDEEFLALKKISINY